jgi:pimeloyl-ACP methyl ester carboxylesterase
VRRASSPSLFAAWRASALGKENLSPRTMQALRQLNLEETYQTQPVKAYAALHELAVKSPSKDVLFALAEVSYALGRKLETQKNGESVAYYYLCAGYAYHYLFDSTEEESAKANPAAEEIFDPRFRLACDLYNDGLAKCIAAAQKIGRLDSRQQLHLPTADGKGFTLSVTRDGFPWHPEEFGPLLFCSDYEVVGLANQFKTYGLGVPLIGTRVAAANAAPGHAFYPKEVSFPVTAFFRFSGTVDELGARRAGHLELYNPLAVRKVRVQDRSVPLETDLTTPLAYFLSRSDLRGAEVAGFFRADSVAERAGIYMFEPYQAGKIPVIMVHGLWSSPLTWAPLFNELRADPVLNQRYQFWFYLYPTVDPYLATAADLRMKLNQMRMELDPKQLDTAFDQMVLVGHSMGGLVNKLLTQRSGDDFWHLITSQPFAAVHGDDALKDKLQQVFFFEPQPGVKRVIYMGTPHRGSSLASFPSRLLDKLVRFPKTLTASTNEFIMENADLWQGPGQEKKFQHIPTSLDMLSPSSPALELLAARPAPAGVHYHSIIGVYHGKGTHSDDGVVPYKSAHVDDAASELLVPGHHIGLHQQPPALLEVRRILYQHLREADADNTIIPVIHAPAILKPPN